MAERYFSKRIKQVADDKKRVQQVREFRLKSTKAVTVKSADSPTLFPTN